MNGQTDAVEKRLKLAKQFESANHEMEEIQQNVHIQLRIEKKLKFLHLRVNAIRMIRQISAKKH